MVRAARGSPGSWSSSRAATRWVEGSEPDRTKSASWLDLLEAGRAFHRAVAHLDRPDCLDARDDWWAVGDRAAWGEQVIDISPFWRPPEYADGVVVADALCWHGAQASLVDQAGVSVAAVARALFFRMATTNQAVSFGPGGVDVEGEARRYDLAAASIGV